MNAKERQILRDKVAEDNGKKLDVLIEEVKVLKELLEKKGKK